MDLGSESSPHPYCQAVLSKVAGDVPPGCDTEVIEGNLLGKVGPAALLSPHAPDADLAAESGTGMLAPQALYMELFVLDVDGAEAM